MLASHVIGGALGLRKRLSGSAYHEDGVPCILDALQKGREVKVRDDLRTRRDDIGRVKIIPYAVDFSYGQPMID